MMIHVVEPTLNSYAGHCHSLVEAIVQSAPNQQVVIWAGRGSEKFWQGGGSLRPYFLASVRRIQAFFLYRRLLSEPGKLLVSTAGTSDFITLDLVSRGLIPEAKVYLYVHWVGAKASKTRRLTKVANRQPNLEILCPTQSGTDFFKGIGFRANCVPYPQNNSPQSKALYQPFHHLVVAGAARLDKGFNRIVDLVEDLARSGSTWPISIQVSATHLNKQSVEIGREIKRLVSTDYLPMTLHQKTLSPESYQTLFLGGISVQPYSITDFEDRVSGVTLDALSSGCPVVVTAGTWLSKIILRFEAGIATSDLTPAGLRLAIERVLSDYDGYSRRAMNAAAALRAEHSADNLMDIVLSPGHS